MYTMSVIFHVIGSTNSVIHTILSYMLSNYLDPVFSVMQAPKNHVYTNSVHISSNLVIQTHIPIHAQQLLTAMHPVAGS